MPEPRVESSRYTPTADVAFWSQAVEGAKVAPTMGVFFGFIADVLQPLGPINAYLFGATTVVTAALIVCWVRLVPPTRSRWNTRFPHRALLFSMYLSAAFGVWFVMQAISGSDERGLLADHVKQISAIQDSLLGIREGVADIKQDTTQILRETRAIGQGVESIGKLGGLIKDPQSPADFYHNARIYELRGDFGQAMAAYDKYISFNQEFVDPFTSYLRMLQQQTGHQGAVQSFQKLTRQFPANRALALVASRLQTGSGQMDRLNTLASDFPDFAPAFLDLAEFFSEERMPDRSKVAADMEQTNLEKVLELNDQGEFLRYYLDKKLAEDLLADARGRKNAEKNTGLFDTSADVQYHPAQAQIYVMDRFATRISYSFDTVSWNDVSDFEIAGAAIKWAQGSVVAAPVVNGTIKVKYVDNRGLESKVYVVDFAEDKALMKAREVTDAATKAVQEARKAAADAQRKAQELLDESEKRSSGPR